MRTFNVGANNYYHTAMICLDEVPFVLYYLGEVVMWICSKVPAIPLPKWPYKSEDGWTTLRDWYGDTHQLFHVYICSVITSLVWKHTRSKHIALPYHYLRKEFPENFREESDWEEEQAFVDRTDELAIIATQEFEELQSKLDYSYIKGVAL